MELTCPSCGARYRVPDGAIGARGRSVSCSNCGHEWRAATTTAAASAMAPGMGPATAPATAPAAALAGRAHLTDRPGGAARAEARSPDPSEPSRVAQLAEIRDMIAQVQSDDRAPGPDKHGARNGDRPGELHGETARSRPKAPLAAAVPGTAPTAPGRAHPDLRRARDADERAEPQHQDPLRRRMAEHDARAARERDERERLRRSMRHGKAETGRGSGAFLSGFLLVVLVAGALLATYLLHEEIVLRVPESAPILAEYVAVMDDLRGTIAESYEQGRAWVMERVGDAV